MHLSKQTEEIYTILIREGKPLSASELAFQVRVAATDVYRLIKSLLDIGLVEKSTGRPRMFRSNPIDEGRGLFLVKQSLWFSDRFGSQGDHSGKDSTPTDEEMQLSFVQGRDELMRVSVDEVIKSSESIDLLRSGHEIPSDLMLAMVQAIKRGVKIRMLVQDYGVENEEQVHNWQKNGILVRRTELKHLRLMIYDSSVGYFMSYKHSDSGQDVGMKIAYPAFTAILSQYFENLWQKSEKTTTI